MTTLNLTRNAPAPDEIYAAIIDMLEGLDEAESAAANARLILLLANHIGDAEVVREAAKIARGQRGA